MEIYIIRLMIQQTIALIEYYSFKKLVEENVFGWLSRVKISQMITKSTKWIDIKELKKHEETNHVVYYLIDDGNREVYIGSAVRLGDVQQADGNSRAGFW